MPSVRPGAGVDEGHIADAEPPPIGLFDGDIPNAVEIDFPDAFRQQMLPR